MREALKEAEAALRAGEIPVGAVVARGERIVARAHNAREGLHDPTAHAEILALRRAAAETGSWRLTGCALYVTLEPCPMCAGAILNARIPRVVFGAADSKAGACGGAIDLMRLPNYPKPNVTGGVLEAECTAALQDFFCWLRANPRPAWRGKRKE